jgi:hypothetical protein
MKEIVGKWMYNAGLDEEHWRCDEEFETKEEAIEAGRKYFTEPDGYEEYEGEKFEGDSFDVGQIAYPDIYVKAWHVIDDVIEVVREQCGDYSEHWLEKVKKEDENLLGDMLTETFKRWLKLTNNEPNFYTLKHITEIKLR